MIKRSGGPAGHRCRFTVLPPVEAASGARLVVAENCSDLCTRLPASVGTCRPAAACRCCCYCRTGDVWLAVSVCAQLSLTAFTAVCCCLAGWLAVWLPDHRCLQDTQVRRVPVQAGPVTRNAGIEPPTKDENVLAVLTRPAAATTDRDSWKLS